MLANPVCYWSDWIPLFLASLWCPFWNIILTLAAFRYDESLMAKVADMSEGLVEERRERRREVLEQVLAKGGKRSADAGM